MTVEDNRPPVVGDVTRLLGQLQSGDPEAVDRLVPLLYTELRGAAQRAMRSERSDHTLSATALVSEAYLRLREQRRIGAGSRTQFLAAAGNTMRRILVDYGRARQRQKRGGGRRPVPFEDIEPFFSDREVDEVLELNDALSRLESMNPQAAEIVQHRFFAGLTLEESAALLGISTKTVQRRWLAARAWLRKEMTTPEARLTG